MNRRDAGMHMGGRACRLNSGAWSRNDTVRVYRHPTPARKNRL